MVWWCFRSNVTFPVGIFFFRRVRFCSAPFVAVLQSLVLLGFLSVLGIRILAAAVRDVDVNLNVCAEGRLRLFLCDSVLFGEREGHSFGARTRELDLCAFVPTLSVLP